MTSWPVRDAQYRIDDRDRVSFVLREPCVRLNSLPVAAEEVLSPRASRQSVGKNERTEDEGGMRLVLSRLVLIPRKMRCYKSTGKDQRG